MKIVTAAILEKEGKILIARRKKGLHLAGKWEFPGGKIEDGETPEECLKRELREEFEIDTEIGEYICESVHDYGKHHIKLLVYRANHVSGEFHLNSHEEMQWVSLSEMKRFEFAEADKPIAKHLEGANNVF